MPSIDWAAIIAIIIPILVEKFNPSPPPIEEAREHMRNPSVFHVFKAARAARKAAGAPRRETPTYMRAISDRAANLTDEECDELYAEATEAEA